MSILHADGSLADPYCNFIALSRYARFRDDLGRRETWAESVDRYVDFMVRHVTGMNGYKPDPELVKEIRQAIKNLDIVPSMRAIMTAGPALEESNIAAYNCSYTPIDDIDVFSEILYILMHGTGVGYSVERRYVSQLPEVPILINDHTKTIVVGDSKLGWATAYRELLHELWLHGRIPAYDLSAIRPAGARLKTFGGRASGPEPLRELFDHTIDTLFHAQGRKLTTLEVHDLVCKIASVVVVGGVRRSAMIALSDLDDEDMRMAKSGEWWTEHPHRRLANISAVYYDNTSIRSFHREWQALVESGSGERGIFNRDAARRQATKRGNREYSIEYGTNPCGEIILRPRGFCNLSEVIVRPVDTEETLARKVALATVLGTWQSTLTHLPFLRDEWRRNAEEERLLGVSLTGVFGNPLLYSQTTRRKTLERLNKIAIQVNAEYAHKLGIPTSAAVTCVKPSGCRPWYALTTTNQGVLTLEELFAASGHPDGVEWQEFNGYEALQGANSSKITRTFDNGVAPVLRIRTSYGIEVESTPNHQWWVKQRYDHNKGLQEVGEWRRADEITPGDILEIVPGTYTSTEEAPLVRLDSRALSMRGDATQIKQPDTMNPEIGWLLGYLWGDGAMSPGQYRIRFIDTATANLEKAKRILQEQFGLVAELKPASGARKAMTLDIGSKMLWHWLIKNGVWKYYADKLDVIPEVVRRSSAETILAFIAGLLDADGHVQVRRVDGEAKDKTVTLTTADEAFAKHVQNVALAVGLVLGRSHNTGGTSKQARKSMYLMQMNAYTLPEALETLEAHSIKMATQHTDLSWVTESQGKDTLHFGKVVSVEVAGFMPTFDVEVADTHWYYAGSVKSHNTVSQLAGVSSGLHPWYAKQYLRAVRVDNKDPIGQLMRDYGVLCEDDVMAPDSTRVFYFPIAAPNFGVTRDQLTAIDHLELWLDYKRYWCDHNPSVTVSVRDVKVTDPGPFSKALAKKLVLGDENFVAWDSDIRDEFLRWVDESGVEDTIPRSLWCEEARKHISWAPGEWDAVRDWVWEHLDEITGVTFLPFADEDHTYAQAPYQSVDYETYLTAKKDFPQVRWADLVFYESDDMTIGSQELACTAGACDVVDIVRS